MSYINKNTLVCWLLSMSVPNSGSKQSYGEP